MKHNACLIAFIWASCLQMGAQKLHLYRNDGKHNVHAINALDSITFPEGSEKMQLWFKNQSTQQIKREAVDSVKINDVSKIAQLTITTVGGAPIDTKEEYVDCALSLDGQGLFPDIEQTGRIRGRGNSTWWWYDKKPYRLKLDAKEKMMGLGNAKDWVLLANYRDPTFLMNAAAFEMGDIFGLAYTNNSRFVEVTLNGDYIGLYMLTEQVQQGKNRVEVDDEVGILLSLDVDDGPGESPDAEDNFWSQQYGMGVCVKYPKDEALTAARKAEIRSDFAQVEALIKVADYEGVKALLDVPSFIKFILIQELTYNVELNAPRSMYLYKHDATSKWTFGPLWDFDGGFFFDWSNMYTNRNYFTGNSLLLGTNPGSGARAVPFFTDLFRNAAFKADYKAYWEEVHEELLPHLFTKLDNYRWQIEEAMERDKTRWRLRTTFTNELDNLKAWLTKHVALMNDAYLEAAPSPNDSEELEANPTEVNADYVVTYHMKLNAHNGYDGGTLSINVIDEIAEKLGLSSPQALASALGTRVGQTQQNHTVTFTAINGTTHKDDGRASTTNAFGHWFDSQGDVCSYGATARCYAELNTTDWYFGMGTYPGLAQVGDTYTITELFISSLNNVRVAIRIHISVTDGTDSEVEEEPKEEEPSPGETGVLIASPANIPADYAVSYKVEVTAASGYSGGKLSIDVIDEIAKKC